MRDDGSLAQQLEGVLTVALEPVPATELSDLLEVGVRDVEAALAALRQSYETERRGFALVELASGWALQSSPEVADAVMRFANRGVSQRLSAAALETLAIVAYRQPVTRVQISALRGVNVDGVVKLLEQRGYIEEAGRAEGPGQPILYRTSELFLDRLGLATLRDLPPVEAFLAPVEVAQALADELLGTGTGET